MSAEEPIRPDANEIRLFREAVASDLTLLARLHREEIPPDLLQALRTTEFPAGLGLRLVSEPGAGAARAMAEALADLPEPLSAKQRNTLDADFADIYLNHRLQAAPNESVWLDQEGLMMQEPMFQVRHWYRRFDLASRDWRHFPDDHLSLQLQFSAHLFLLGQDLELLEDIVRFNDEHLLRWIGDFSTRVAQRCGTDFYAALAVLTQVYLDELRDFLALILDQPRPSPEEIEQRMAPKAAPPAQGCDVPFAPGVAPSW